MQLNSRCMQLNSRCMQLARLPAVRGRVVEEVREAAARAEGIGGHLAPPDGLVDEARRAHLIVN